MRKVLLPLIAVVWYFNNDVRRSITIVVLTHALGCELISELSGLILLSNICTLLISIWSTYCSQMY